MTRPSDAGPLFSLPPLPSGTTQQLAHRHVLEDLPERHRQVIDALQEHGPQALWELCNRLGKPMNALSGRITELVTEKRIERTGDRRVNPQSGQKGYVYRLCRHV